MKFSNVSFRRGIIYALVFIFTLHVTPGTYINSSFLEQFVGEKGVGIVYAIASLVTALGFIFIRPILTKFGNYKTFVAVLLLELLSLVVMSMTAIPSNYLLIAYIVGFTARNLGFFHLDIFLEAISTDKDTGGIRGFYLTMMNASFLVGPLLASFVIADAQYWKVYLMSGVILLPTLFVTMRYLHDFKDPQYEKFELRVSVKKIWQNNNLQAISMVNTLLRFFYAWMIIYTPIYLTQHVGFSIAETTMIIGIALIAFVISQAPLGYIADKILGEQELLILGFLIMALSTASMSFVTTESFWAWVIILFTTRIGASIIEVMSETYFFKKVDGNNVNIISTFRMLRPAVYLVAPSIASLLLIFIDIKFLFLVLGIIMLYGIKYSLALRDTL